MARSTGAGVYHAAGLVALVHPHHHAVAVAALGEELQGSGLTPDLVQGVVQVNTLVDAITLSSREQILGVEQVNAAISQIDGATQQNAALVEQAAAATMSLKAQAVDLDTLMGVFQLDPAAEPA